MWIDLVVVRICPTGGGIGGLAADLAFGAFLVHLVELVVMITTQLDLYPPTRISLYGGGILGRLLDTNLLQ